MKNFYKELEKLIKEGNPSIKIKQFKTLYNEFKNKELDHTPIETIEVFSEPCFKNYCKIVDSNEVPMRTKLHTKEGMGILLHAITHIEFSAIDLALDACYRFQKMPQEYYEDWMEVADDEVRHFEMLITLLKEYDVSYGDYPVHQGLFDASMKTLDFIPRMALIPRYMEANGLDANQVLIAKLQHIPNTKKVIDTLNIILDEEVDHVKKGDKWYKYGCSKKENFSCDYFKIVQSVYPNSFRQHKKINEEARLKAGFSQEELEKMKSF
jgi:uncharacterized ferritin-like protein (DUF455 family)